ncbi:PepSY-like domain-containing protein [Capnocytophaga sp.]|uniref:PepSY-like domain-containing protein n=1 Tax=Capnocytophaga sp. TaxID=44737 RepID=UPI0026DCCADF|nr:PepSY-like domain-containing protein [Capnocytophaga sp.]MDO5105446.1 PepSY-like domain-containing protein [Capnocytophaga sp.]
MRKLVLKLAVVALATSLMAFSCNKENDVIQNKNLPEVAQSFVSKYFKANIVKTEIESNGSYSVDLSNGVEIDFDANGNWTKVDARDRDALVDKATSMDFIPQSILTHVAKNHPNNPINSIEKTKTGYEVELVGVEGDLHFDVNGLITNPQNNGNGTNPPANNPNPNVPQGVATAADAFLKTYFPTFKVVKVEVERTKVEYDLDNGTDVDFDLNGNWINVDARDGQALTNVAFIPQNIVNHLKTTYPNNAINGIEKTATGYEVELVGVKNDIHFNANGNPKTNGTGNGNTGGNTGGNTNTVIIGEIPQGVKTNAENFIKTYFPNVAITKIEVEKTKVEYKLANGVEIDFDLNGNWKEVDAPDNQALTATGFIPEKIRTYLAQMYPDRPVNGIEKTATGYEVEFSNLSFEVAFDLNGNYSHTKD